MLVEILIVELQKIPAGTNVCVFDWRKSLSDDIGDGSTEGVYFEFCVEMHELDSEEAAYYKDREDKDFVPWCAISFENTDYDDDGHLIAAE